MSYSVRYDPKRKIVRIDVEIAVDADLAKEMCLDAIKLARVHECKSVLVAFRESVVADNTMGIYGFAKSLPDLGFDPSVRVANVIPRQDPDHRFFETVAKNQGFEFRYFTDIAEAEEWLCGERPASDGRRKHQETVR